MKTADLFRKKQVLSFEVFPPKRTVGLETVYTALDTLQSLKPDFISVTHGVGGTDTHAATLEIATCIKRDYGVESVAHMPSVLLTRESALAQLEDFRQAGIENILALRGDMPEDAPLGGDFQHASDLISFIREHGDFNIIAACYPEGHVEAPDIITDTRNLKTKVDAGVNHLISQLFFDNDCFYRFRERAALAGIHVPIEAGIMPVVNKKQIERMVTLCGATLPKKFVAMMARYENNPEAMRDAGIAYAIDQIVDLVAQGVDGIHLYTMNNPYNAQKIYEAVFRLMSA